MPTLRSLGHHLPSGPLAQRGLAHRPSRPRSRPASSASQDAEASTLASARESPGACETQPGPPQARTAREASSKQWRDLGVIQVSMIAAAGADQLVHVGVAALDTAVHDADRLAAAGPHRCRDRADRRAGAVTTSSGVTRSHRRRRSRGRGANPAAGRTVGPPPVAESEMPALLTEITTRKVGPLPLPGSGAATLLSSDATLRLRNKTCPAGAHMPDRWKGQVSSPNPLHEYLCLPEPVKPAFRREHVASALFQASLGAVMMPCRCLVPIACPIGCVRLLLAC